MNPNQKPHNVLFPLIQTSFQQPQHISNPFRPVLNPEIHSKIRETPYMNNPNQDVEIDRPKEPDSHMMMGLFKEKEIKIMKEQDEIDSKFLK